jgi:hypothetical protein
MMKNRLALLCFFIVLFFQAAQCQDKDFGIWYGFDGEYSMTKNLSLKAETMLRTNNNASSFDEAFLETGITYKLNKYISVGAFYRLTDKQEKNDEYYINHKIFEEVKGTLPVKDLVFSLRFRLQEQIKTYFNKESDKETEYQVRFKLKALYKVPDFPVDPYITYETFSVVFTGSDRLVAKNRFEAGLEYKIAKKQSIGLAYIFERDFQPHLSDMNIISVGYSVKF